MTVQEILDERGKIYNRFSNTEWKEGSVEEITNDYPFIGETIVRLNRYGFNKNVAILKSLLNEATYHLYLFTEKRLYSIVVCPTYIGCVYSNRYELPLEDWHRGNDLADGKATAETFNKILTDIVCTELVRYDDGSKPRTAVGTQETVIVEETPIINKD